MRRKYLIMMMAGTIMLGSTFAGCAATQTNTSSTTQENTESSEEAADESAEESADASSEDTQGDAAEDTAEVPTEDSITINDTVKNTADGEHAIEVDGKEAEYKNTKVVKSGDSEGDEADFYGDNASVFATNGATLNLSEMVVESDGEHANGVFSYGEGTTVNVSDSVINTKGNCSGGLMTTGGGTMNAENLNISTSGNSSAAIRSDRGGGTVTVKKGSYKTSGSGSPAIYSTADITVEDADLESTTSEGVVVEGKNSVTLKNVTLTADNNKLNSDKSDTYKAVMIYQSMSGDANEGTASYTMEGGSLTNKNGDVFFVNNTTADITLKGAKITNEDKDGLFLRAAAAGWGNEGSNGGQVSLKASGQTIDGDIVVDDVSTLNMYLADGSAFNGAINSDKQAGDVYVELTDGSKWTLSGDSYITSLTCDADSIDLNGHKLYVDGEEYTEGEASTGEAVEAKATTSNEKNGNTDGNPPEKPDGASQDGEMSEGGAPSGEKPEGEPPSGEKPDGNPPSGEKPSGNPPEKPDQSSDSSN